MTQTIIIVDDHPSFRATARRLLEIEGFAVLGEATDGASAIVEILRLAPDVVLLDVEPARHRRVRGRRAAPRAGVAERYRPHFEP